MDYKLASKAFACTRRLANGAIFGGTRYVAGMVLLLLLLLAPPPAFSQTLKIGLAEQPSDFPVFGPAISQLEPSVAVNMFETLVEFDQQGMIIPKLAESWTLSDDSQTLTLSLRQSVRFHNGEPFTAQDVAQVFGETGLRPDTNVEVVDDGTLQFRFESPWYGALAALATRYIYKQDTGYPFGVVGTGPYVADTVNPGVVTRLNYFPDHWSEKPDWLSVEFRSLFDPAASAAALLSGDLDIIPVFNPADLRRISQNSDLTAYQTLTGSVYFLGVKSPQAQGVSDEIVARAIAGTIDRESLSRDAANLQIRPASEITPPFFAGASDAPSVDLLKPDVDQARQLLADAGISNPQVTFLYSQERYPNDARMGASLARDMRNAGIAVKERAMPGSAFVQTLSSGSGPGFDVSLFRWNAFDQLTLIRDMLDFDTRSNFLGVSTPDLVDAISRAETTFNTTEREAIVNQVARELQDSGNVIPLGYETAMWASSKDVDLNVDRFQRIRVSRVFNYKESQNPKNCGSKQQCCQDGGGGKCCSDADDLCPNSCR
jgi:peptide/nickel transport system substrate-binding protein